MSILKGVNIKKYYDNLSLVLDNINIEIEEGEFLSIIGSSGAGKSTLLYVLSGLEKLSEGSVLFNNRDITRLSDIEMSKIRRTEFGFIFQFYNLVPDISVYDNIAFSLELEGLKRREIKGRVEKVSKEVGIFEKLKEKPYKLSGGQQQRVAIARALVTNPKIIFADEPTGNLDTVTSREVLELLKRINKNHNTTIVMVTHDNSAAEYGDRIIKISDGRWQRVDAAIK